MTICRGDIDVIYFTQLFSSLTSGQNYLLLSNFSRQWSRDATLCKL